MKYRLSLRELEEAMCGKGPDELLMKAPVADDAAFTLPRRRYGFDWQEIRQVLNFGNSPAKTIRS